jgi:hypothetical protein
MPKIFIYYSATLPITYQLSVLTLIQDTAPKVLVIVGFVEVVPVDAIVTPAPCVMLTVPADPILIKFMTEPVVIATLVKGGSVIVVVPVFEYVMSLLSASAKTNVSDVLVTALTERLAIEFICAAVNT